MYKKTSSKNRTKSYVIIAVLILVGFTGVIRVFTGTWLGAKAEVAVGYVKNYNNCNPSKRPDLSIGKSDSTNINTGSCVKALQESLNDCCAQNLKVDGIFGPLTKQAVVNVQTFFGLTVDGIVGPKTWPTIDYLASLAVQKAGNEKQYKAPQKVWDEAHPTAPATATPTPAPATSTPAPVTTIAAPAAWVPHPNNCVGKPELNQNKDYNSDCVAKMQAKLNSLGVVTKVDGLYGPQTAISVHQYKNLYCYYDEDANGSKWPASYWDPYECPKSVKPEVSLIATPSSFTYTSAKPSQQIKLNLKVTTTSGNTRCKFIEPTGMQKFNSEFIPLLNKYQEIPLQVAVEKTYVHVICWDTLDYNGTKVDVYTSVVGVKGTTASATSGTGSPAVSKSPAGYYMTPGEIKALTMCGASSTTTNHFNWKGSPAFMCTKTTNNIIQKITYCDKSHTNKGSSTSTLTGTCATPKATTFSPSGSLTSLYIPYPGEQN